MERTSKVNRIGGTGSRVAECQHRRTTPPGTHGITRISSALVPGYESDMPGFQDKLSDADMWAVLSYIESTWPADIRIQQQRMK
jgi:hypothetical protein